MEKTCKKIILGFIIPTIFTIILCYPLLPVLLNYPPNSINNSFQLKVVPTYYSIYFIIISIGGVVAEYIFLKHKFSFFKKSDEEVKNNPERFSKILYSITNKTVMELLIVPIVILTFFFIILKVDLLLTIKLVSVIFIILTVSVSMSYIYMKKQIKYLLERLDLKTHIDKKSKLVISTYIQFIPFTIASLMIMGLLLISQFSNRLSDNLFEVNMNRLSNDFENYDIKDETTLKKYIDEKIKEDNDLNFFYVDYNNNFTFSKNTNPSTFFKEYFNEFSINNGGRVYENYGVEIQAAVIFTDFSSDIQAVGYRYNVVDSNLYTIFLITIILVLCLDIFILHYYSKALTEDITSITDKIVKFNKEKNIVGTIPVTSNDEIGLLQYEYNLLQNTTKGFVEEIEEKQDIIVKQQQLVSIGELAGGVAHDINTPISAIKTGITMLSMKSDRPQEEKDTLQRMDNCATKIINIVNSMRNQIRNLGNDTKIKFKISSVINDIKVITYHELMKNHTEININIEDDVEIEGDPTKLGQVLTNLIVNASQAYGEKEGKIDIIVRKTLKHATITVIDYAGGMDDSIKPYVFKNILTTKGTAGTGLGLYLAYSVIKGNFNGEIDFDSKKGEGTSFHIRIPLVENNDVENKNN